MTPANSPTEPGEVYRKVARSAAIPPDYLRWEAAGLRWLAEVTDGAPVVEVLAVSDQCLELRRLRVSSPSAAAATAFGERLAITHRDGAAGFGAAPPGWHGPGYLGPFSEPLPLALTPRPIWGLFWAEQRIAPMAAEGLRRGVYGPNDAQVFERLAQRAIDGHFDTDDSPARLHGDLWSGNIMWTPAGVTLIDAAAHGGHPETDLAMLALFGCPYLAQILAGYQNVQPLAEGWTTRVGLHQVHPLMVHAVLFGGGYIGQSLAMAARYC